MNEAVSWQLHQWQEMLDKAFELLDHPQAGSFLRNPNQVNPGSHGWGFSCYFSENSVPQVNGKFYAQTFLWIHEPGDYVYSDPPENITVWFYVSCPKGVLEDKQEFPVSEFNQFPYYVVKKVHKMVDILINRGEGGEGGFQEDPTPDPSIELSPVGSIESKEFDVSEKDVENLVEGLVQEADKRPSTRPTKQVRDLIQQLDASYKKIEMLQAQADKILSEIKPLAKDNEIVEEQLMGLLQDYQDRCVRLKGIIAQVETTPEKKAHVPQWAKWRDWVLQKFNAISVEMYKEAQEMLESFKNVTPPKDKFTFKRESIEEGVLDRINRIVRSMRVWAQKSNAAITELERAVYGE